MILRIINNIPGFNVFTPENEEEINETSFLAVCKLIYSVTSATFFLSPPHPHTLYHCQSIPSKLGHVGVCGLRDNERSFTIFTKQSSKSWCDSRLERVPFHNAMIIVPLRKQCQTTEHKILQLKKYQRLNGQNKNM